MSFSPERACVPVHWALVDFSMEWLHILCPLCAFEFGNSIHVCILCSGFYHHGYCMSITIPGNFVHTVVVIVLEVYCVVVMIEVVFLAQQETKVQYKVDYHLIFNHSAFIPLLQHHILNRSPGMLQHIIPTHIARDSLIE